MTNSSGNDLGKLVLRLCLGVLLLLHGISKLKTGVGWLAQPLSAYGLPSFVSYGVYLGEVLGPILIILGLFTRLGALLIGINMLFVFGLIHMAELTTLSKTGGWALELQGFYLFTSVAVLLLGAGRFSLGGIKGRWN